MLRAEIGHARAALCTHLKIVLCFFLIGLFLSSLQYFRHSMAGGHDGAFGPVGAREARGHLPCTKGELSDHLLERAGALSGVDDDGCPGPSRRPFRGRRLLGRRLAWGQLWDGTQLEFVRLVGSPYAAPPSSLRSFGARVCPALPSRADVARLRTAHGSEHGPSAPPPWVARPPVTSRSMRPLRFPIQPPGGLSPLHC